MRVQVIVCDQQALTLLGVRSVLEPEPDIELLRETSSVGELLTLARELGPDVVVLGMPIAGADVLSTVRQLIQARHGTPLGLILMTAGTDEALLLEALRAGVRGVASKEHEPAELVRAIRAVAAGEAVLTTTMTRHLLDWAARVPVATIARRPLLDRLSHRERTVLEMVSNGLSDAEVAAALHVSVATVRSHMHHVTSKLELSGRAQAVAFAYRHGLVLESASEG
jgi:DNA-binding NarL/FixJ family response regulator